MLLANMMPVGVGKGANETVLMMCTLRDASVGGAVGRRDMGTVVATLRYVLGSGLGATEGGTATGSVSGTGEHVVGESVVAMVERMLDN